MKNRDIELKEAKILYKDKGIIKLTVICNRGICPEYVANFIYKNWSKEVTGFEDYALSNPLFLSSKNNSWTTNNENI